MRRMMMLVALLVVVAAGCKAEANVVFEIRADGSGSLAAEFGFDEELMTLLGNEDPTEGLFEGLDFGELGDDVTQRVEGDFTYFTTSTPFADTSELEQLLASEQDLPFDGTFDVEVTDDEIRINAETADTGDLVPSDAPIDIPMEQLQQFFAAHIRIKVPGSAQSNADRVLSDGTLEWDVPLDGGALSIEVVSDVGGGGGFPVLPIVGVAGVAAVLAAAWFIVRRRGTAVEAIPEGETAMAQVPTTADPEPPAADADSVQDTTVAIDRGEDDPAPPA